MDHGLVRWLFAYLGAAVGTGVDHDRLSVRDEMAVVGAVVVARDEGPVGARRIIDARDIVINDASSGNSVGVSVEL